MAIFRVSQAREAFFEGDSSDDTLDAGLYLEGSGNMDDYPLARAELSGGGGADQILLGITAVEAHVDARVYGGEGDDSIGVDIDAESSSPNVRIDVDGGAGDDAISVTSYDGAAGMGGVSTPTETVIRGGLGDDEIVSNVFGGYNTVNLVYGGDGDDKITAVASNGSEDGMSVGTLVYGDGGNDEIDVRVGSGSNVFDIQNEAHGGLGNDTVTAGFTFWDVWGDSQSTAVNLLYGDEGDDSLTGDASAASGEPSITAYSELYGGSGNDYVKASGGDNNVLFGNEGNDSLYGSGNADRLIGGGGTDFLRGNGGADAFEFWGARGLGAGERDRIDDFTIGEDRIDVSRIDANAYRNGNQAFRFSGEGEWQGTGRIWVEDNPDNDGSIVYASTGQKMLAINLLDGTSVDASDYSAGDFIL